jgi:hypothetical protein
MSKWRLASTAAPKLSREMTDKNDPAKKRTMKKSHITDWWIPLALVSLMAHEPKVNQRIFDKG